MRKFIIGVILMTFVLGGCTSMLSERQLAERAMLKKLNEQIELGMQRRYEAKKQNRNAKKDNADKFPENLLVDTFTGSTCNGNVKVEINITAAIQDGLNYQLYGTFRSVDPQGQKLETYLQGNFSLPSRYSSESFMSLYANKPPTLEDIFVKKYGRGLMGGMNYNSAKTSKKVLADFEKKFGVPPFGDDVTHPQPTVALFMNITRDTEGKGWIGSFDGDGFNDCHEIVMVSKNGKTTSELPPVTNKLAMRMSYLKNPNKKENSEARILYWLKIAEQKGHVKAPFEIAQFLEQQGKTSPQSYQQALQYYRAIVENTGDQRAQMALANMYTEGRGTPENPGEAKKWRDLAIVTQSKAAKVCGSPNTLAGISAIIQDEQTKEDAASMVASMITGMSMSLGKIRVTEIAVDDLVSMEEPFACTAYGERVGAAIDASTMPDVEYYAKDGYGNVTYVGDNSGEKAVVGGMANFANKIAGRSYKGSFKIEPLGDMRYKITKYDSSVSATVDLQTGKSNNVPKGSRAKLTPPPQKEQQIEQNPKIDDWAKDYFNKQ